MEKEILVIGGTSGLGLELAKTHHELGFSVTVVGRQNPHLEQFKYGHFNISADSASNASEIERLLTDVQKVDTIIYAPGYYQEGLIDELPVDEIEKMIHVNLTIPALLISRLKQRKQGLKVILITSSSAYTPRKLEPVYAASKAGIEMLGRSLALDNELGKVVVAAPSGMKTPFWSPDKDVSDYLEPDWVAHEITNLSTGDFKYRSVRITRNPPNAEIIESK